MRTDLWFRTSAAVVMMVVAAAWFGFPFCEGLPKPVEEGVIGLGRVDAADGNFDGSVELVETLPEDEETEVIAAVGMEETMEAKFGELRVALGEAARIQDAALRQETVASLCYRWAEMDPRSALEIALDYRLQDAPGEVIANLTQQWAAVNFTAAREWIDAQPPGDLRSELAARVGFLWAQRDPQAAADFILSKTTPGPIQVEATISVLHQWARMDRAAASAWAGKFPVGELRERALWETRELSEP